jgi:cytochrome c oxidase subunit 3
MSAIAERIDQGGGPPPPAPSGRGGGGGGRASRRASITGLFVLFAAVTMFFAALTSAMVVRRGLSDDWASTALPRILWLNTAVLAASSVALEAGRRALNRGERPGFRRYWIAGSLLGIFFLSGQSFAWGQLNGQGVYVNSNPSSSFFFVLTVAHALHLAGGILALAYAGLRVIRAGAGPEARTPVEVASYYWHFMDGLWIYLMFLLFVWG